MLLCHISPGSEFCPIINALVLAAGNINGSHHAYLKVAVNDRVGIHKSVGSKLAMLIADES